MRIKPHVKWLMTVPVISTRHLTENDDAILTETYGFRQDGIPGLLAKLTYGWLFCLDEVEPSDFLEFSDTFRQLIEHLKNEVHFKYLRLDAEGDLIPGLPVFDW